MTDSIKLQDYLAFYTEKLLQQTATAVEDLNLEELHYRPEGPCNSIAFDIWHIIRTADNLIHFAFERKVPIWIVQGLNEKWNLPKSDQGTGMTPEEAYALRFPGAPQLAQYSRDVSDVIVPRIQTMSDEYLLERIDIKPNGNLSKKDIIGQVIISHGNNHYGQVNMALTMLGKPGLGI